jgi:O-antigen ligase
MTTLISSIYSPIWSLSLVSAGKWLAAIALVAVYAEGLHPIHCWRPAITVTLFVLVGGQVGAIVLEFLTSGTLGLGGAEVHRLTGIEHPVRLGLIGALSLLMGGVWVFGGDPVVPALRVLFRWAVGGLGILIIALTVSRTGLFVLMIAGLTILVVARRRLSLILAVVYPMLIVLPLFGLILGVEAVEGLVERYVFRYSREETFTLTGRFEVWAEAADLIAGRPLTGYGFVAGPRLELARRVASWRPMHAHNAWLQAGLDVGLVGASAFALSAVGFLGLALRGVRSPPGQNARGRICGCQLLGAVVVVALAIASVSEPVFASGASGLGTLWLVGGTVLAVGRSCRPTSASKAASPCGSF